jgi:hypothetical protein
MLIVFHSLSEPEDRLVRIALRRRGPYPRAPAQGQGNFLIRTDDAAGDFVSGHHELHLEVELVVAVETCQVA